MKVEKENVNIEATQVCPMSDIESLTVSRTRETVHEESPEQKKLKVKVCETSPGSGTEVVNSCHVHICESNSENNACLEAAKVYPINDLFRTSEIKTEQNCYMHIQDPKNMKENITDTVVTAQEIVKVTQVDLISEMEAVHDCHMHDADIAQEINKVLPVDLISEMEAVHDCHIQGPENMKENISDIAQ